MVSSVLFLFKPFCYHINYSFRQLLGPGSEAFAGSGRSGRALYGFRTNHKEHCTATRWFCLHIPLKARPAPAFSAGCAEEGVAVSAHRGHQTQHTALNCFLMPAERTQNQYNADLQILHASRTRLQNACVLKAYAGILWLQREKRRLLDPPTSV